MVIRKNNESLEATKKRMGARVTHEDVGDGPMHDEPATSEETQENSDLVTWGSPEGSLLIYEQSSKSEGWTKESHAMLIPGEGVVIHSTFREFNHRDKSVSLAAASSFVSGVCIVQKWEGGVVVARQIVGAHRLPSEVGPGGLVNTGDVPKSSFEPPKVWKPGD